MGESVPSDVDPDQVSGGLGFTSRGAYGSAIFDPMDHTHLEIVVCDPCIELRARRREVHLVDPSGSPTHTFFDPESGDQGE